MKPKAIIFDIDGVLAERAKNEDGTFKREWREYDKVDLDKPIMCMFEYLKYYILHKDKPTIFFITGRKQSCASDTVTFIVKHLTSLLTDRQCERNKKVQKNYIMRPNDDHRPGHELKKEIYEKYIKDNYEVIMAIDDDPEITKMWKEQGIFALEVKRPQNYK